MSKPEVDYIKGIAPAIAIEQKVNSRNPRSTVGTSTEIYEYLKLLYARIGKTYSPVSGKQVERHTVSKVTDEIYSSPIGTEILIFVPVQMGQNGRKAEEHLSILLQQGFSRIIIDDQILRIEEALKDKSSSKEKDIFLVIDRILISEKDDDLRSRIADSVQTAFYEGHNSLHGKNSITKENLKRILIQISLNSMELNLKNLLQTCLVLTILMVHVSHVKDLEV